MGTSWTRRPVPVVILAAGLGTRMKSRRARLLPPSRWKNAHRAHRDTALSLASPERVFVVGGGDNQADEVRTPSRRRGVRFHPARRQKGTGHSGHGGREVIERLGRPVWSIRRLQQSPNSVAFNRPGGASEPLGCRRYALVAGTHDPHGLRRVDGHQGRVLASSSKKAARPSSWHSRQATSASMFRAIGLETVGEAQPTTSARILPTIWSRL